MEQKITNRLERNEKPRIVVLGGGFAGINFIRKMNGLPVQIVLVDQNNYHTFQPLIYQVATAGLEPGAVSSPLRGLFDDQENIHFRMAKAERVDSEVKLLHTSAGPISYDFLVLANGSTGNFFGNDTLREKTHTLNDLEDAISFREQFISNFERALLLDDDKTKKLMNVVVVGGGPTGVELAGAIAELRKNVLPNDYPDFDTDRLTIYLIEGLERLLPTMAEESGAKAESYLESLGVNVITETMVEDYSEEVVKMSNGDTIKSNMLVWAAGVKGNAIKGFDDPQLENGYIKVDTINRVLGSPHIYAIGDAAIQKSEDYPDGLPNLAQVAIQQGNHLARNFRKMLKGKEPKPFSFKNKGVMATVGRNRAVVELGSVKYGGRLGWFTWVFVHLFSILGIRRKLAVFAHWVWSYFTYDKGNRLILGQAKENKQTSREILFEGN